MAAQSERIGKLEAMLSKQPHDPFLLYGLGMEYKKLGDWAKAIEYFDRTIQTDSGYCYAYFQKGQTQEATGNGEGAREAYTGGIAAAVKKGDGHAQEELQAALAMIE